MAEPYVPIANYTASDELLTELEVTTDASETNANALNTAVTNAQTAKNSAELVLATKFELLFLVGA